MLLLHTLGQSDTSGFRSLAFSPLIGNHRLSVEFLWAEELLGFPVDEEPFTCGMSAPALLFALEWSPDDLWHQMIKLPRVYGLSHLTRNNGVLLGKGYDLGVIFPMCNRVFVGLHLVLLLQQLLWARESIYQAVLPEVLLHAVSPPPDWDILANHCRWSLGSRSEEHIGKTAS